MWKIAGKKFLEALLSIVPIAVIVLIIYSLQFTMVFPDDTIPTDRLIGFIVSLVVILVGMALFSLGSDTAMSKVGKYIGSSITKRKSIVVIIIISFLLGLMITIAEPDLTVLGELLSEKLNPWILKIVIGTSVGVFLCIGLLRIIFQKSLKIWLIFMYFIVFALAVLLDDANGDAILSITFDSGGVTTGPVTVPFLLTFGAGVAAVRGGKNSSSDSFGVMGICSVGPLIFTMTYLIIMSKFGVDFSTLKNSVNSSLSVLEVVGHTFFEMILAIGPILVFFIIYELIFIRISWKELLEILLGFLLTYVGLSIFLSGAKYGLIPVAYSLGNVISDPVYGGTYDYLLFIIAILVGIAVVLVEPGVHVLTEQVNEISNGAISKKKMLIALCIGVAAAIVLAVFKYMYASLSLAYFYVPLYLIAVFLSFLVPDIYTAIAFDSGGVASGTMSSCFVLPFIIGIANAAEGRGTGFGVIGLISAMPIICVQFVGFATKFKTSIAYAMAKKRVREENDCQVVHLD